MASKVMVAEVKPERDSTLHDSLLQPPSTCSASFNSLPSDILYIITLQLLHDAEHQHDLPLRLSHICRSLRIFALGTPTLWSRISFINPRPKSLSLNEQRLWLQRSGDAPLHIQMEPPRRADCSPSFSIKALGRIMALLLPHIERWASFQFDSPRLGSKGRHLVLDLLRGKTAPELETLIWFVPRGQNQRRYLPPSSMAPPKLRDLVICGKLERADILQIGQQWPTLRRVALHRMRFWAPAEYWESNAGRSLVPMVSAPNLRRLSTDEWSLIELGVRLNAPALVVVRPMMVLADQTIKAIARLSSFPWPHLRGIAVNLGNISDFPALVRVLESFQELTGLDIFDYHDELPIVDLLCSSLPTLSRLSIAGNHIHLSAHARRIAQTRLESPYLASLTYLKLDSEIAGSYSLGDYMWLRDHVSEFVSGKVPTPPEQLPLETKRPRRRYRKARTKRR